MSFDYVVRFVASVAFINLKFLRMQIISRHTDCKYIVGSLNTSIIHASCSYH